MFDFEILPHLDLQTVAVTRLILHARIILFKIIFWRLRWQLKRRPDFSYLKFRKTQEASNCYIGVFSGNHHFC